MAGRHLRVLPTVGVEGLGWQANRTQFSWFEKYVDAEASSFQMGIARRSRVTQTCRLFGAGRLLNDADVRRPGLAQLSSWPFGQSDVGDGSKLAVNPMAS